MLFWVARGNSFINDDVRRDDLFRDVHRGDSNWNDRAATDTRNDATAHRPLVEAARKPLAALGHNSVALHKPARAGILEPAQHTPAQDDSR